MIQSIARLTAFAAVAAYVTACGSVAPDPGTSCTEQFVFYTVKVNDGAGAPVADATVTSTLVRTGETLASNSLALLAQGYYPIIDDASRPKLLASGDSVHVTGTSSKGSFAAGYRFSPGDCHVTKVSGPDSVTVH